MYFVPGQDTAGHFNPGDGETLTHFSTVEHFPFNCCYFSHFEYWASVPKPILLVHEDFCIHFLTHLLYIHNSNWNKNLDSQYFGMVMIEKGTDHQSGHHRLNLLMLRDKRDQARQTYCLACCPHCVYNVSWFDTTEFQELQLIPKLNIYGLCLHCRVYNLAKKFCLGFTISLWYNMSRS